MLHETTPPRGAHGDETPDSTPLERSNGDRRHRSNRAAGKKLQSPTKYRASRPPDAKIVVVPRDPPTPLFASPYRVASSLPHPNALSASLSRTRVPIHSCTSPTFLPRRHRVARHRMARWLTGKEGSSVKPTFYGLCSRVSLVISLDLLGRTR